MTEYKVVLLGGTKCAKNYNVAWVLYCYKCMGLLILNTCRCKLYIHFSKAAVIKLSFVRGQFPLHFAARRAGKSALVARFAKNQFLVQDIQTVEDFFTKKAEIDNEICCLDILDTCGTARFSKIKQQHISYGEGFVFVFAVDNKRSFEEIETIREQVRVRMYKHCLHGLFVFIIS